MANGSDGQVIIDVDLNSDKVVKEAEQVGKKIGDSFDKNISKAAKQLDNVSKAIDNTNKKIDLETQKLNKLKDAYEKSADPKVQEKLQQQIVNTEGKITSLEGKLNGLKDKQINLTTKVNTESLDKAVDNINKAGSKISDIGGSLTTKVTLPVVASLGLASKAAADFEHQMADISKEVKAKGEDVNTVMSQMATNSIKWSEDYGQSTDDINKGLLILVKDGYSGAESMDIMNTALKTARGANEDLFTTIDKLGGSLEAYQMKSDNAATTTANMAKMADTFAYISNHTKASIDSLGEAFSTVGQTASALGQPMEQTAAAIGILESSNIDASTAATSLKAGLVNLTKPTKQMQAGMKELGLTAFDSNGNMKDFATIIDDVGKGSAKLTTQQKEAAIAMVFGKESLASWTTLVNKGGDYLRTLATDAGNATGEVQELSDSMANTPVNKMKEAEASFKALGVTFGEEVLPELMPLVQELTNMLKSFSQLDEGTKKQIIDFALMAAATGPVLKVVGELTKGVGSLIEFGGKLTPIISKITGSIGEVAAVGATTGEVEALGVSLGTVATALAPFAIGLAAVGTVGYATYDTLSKKVTPSVDLFADDVKYASETVQTEHGTMQRVVETSATKISEATKKAVQSYLDMDNDAKKYLQDLYINNSTITSGIVADSKSKFDAMAKATINGFEKQKNDSISKLTELFGKEKSLTSEEQNEILKKTNDYYSNKASKVQSDEARINQIMSNASNENRSLKLDEIEEIKNLQNDMRGNAVSALSQQQSETAVILQRMKDYDGQITAEQASEKIKALNESRDKAIQSANDEYNQKIAIITDMRDNVGSITAEEAEKMIDNAKKQRDDTVQAAQDTRNQAVEKILGMNSDISSSVDTTTGNILTNWEKLKAWWNSWQPQPKTVEIKTEEQAAGNAYNNAMNSQPWAQNNPYLQIGQGNNYTGTTTLKTGLSYVDEHGYETANNSNVKMLGNGLAFLIGNHYTGGDGINDHMTTVNEMHNDITGQVGESVGKIVNTLISSLSGQGTLLNQIATNTAETVNVGEKGNELNAKTATDLINNLKASTNGTFSTLESEITSANQAKEKADKMKVEDNYWYSSTKAQLDALEKEIEKTTDEASKKILEQQKNDLQSTVDYYKDAAQKEIDTCKEQADEEIKIAEQKKEQLTQLAEATTTALKNEYEAQKKAAEDSINAELTSLENDYNKKVADIENKLKSQEDEIDKKIKALDKQSTDNSRSQERTDANNNINALTTKMNNTASQADKRSLQLQINDAKKALQEKEDTWNIEDQKQALEDEKTLLEQRATNRKKSLEDQYNQEKAEKEKELKNTDDYYNKLMEDDSINAKARYLLLQGNQEELVKLLQSYNPLWQDAGQSLADSLLTGLNSKKEDIKAAVADILGAANSAGVPPPSQYYDASTGKMVGYASGTSFNPTSGYYLTNENGWETSNGDVAYVSQGTAIKNHMQSIADMKAEISNQLANDLPYITSQLNSTLQAEQAETRRMISNVVNNSTSNNQNIQYDGSNQFHIENLNLNTGQDVEQLFNEAESIRTSKRPF